MHTYIAYAAWETENTSLLAGTNENLKVNKKIFKTSTETENWVKFDWSARPDLPFPSSNIWKEFIAHIKRYWLQNNYYSAN